MYTRTHLLVNQDNVIAVKPLLVCLGVLLSAQDVKKSFWLRPANVRAFTLLTNFLADPRPKVRKIAQQAVLEVSVLSCFLPKLIHECCFAAATNTHRSWGN